MFSGWFDPTKWRALFDNKRWERFPGLVVVVASIPAALTRWFLASVLPDSCRPLPVSVARLEVTFSVARFASLLNAEDACRAAAIAQLAWRDMLFSIAYPFALLAIYLWLERWRRAPVRDTAKPDLTPFEAWQPFVIAAPLAAGLLDLVEDATLWFAAKQVPTGGPIPSTPLLGIAVIAGSIAASVKWALLLAWLAGCLAELYRGPRGYVLRQVRFSVLAVALGALPLLAVPQGQDILQRLAEGLHPYWRVLFGVVALTCAAFVVWYCARRLVQVDFSRFGGARGPVAVPPPADWQEFFAEQIPRILGVGILALSGLAFAQAGLAAKRYAIVAGASVGALMLFEWWKNRGKVRIVDDTATNPPKSAADARLREGFTGRLVGLAVAVAGGFGTFALGEVADVGGSRSALKALRFAAALSLVMAWAFYIFVRYRRIWLAARDARTSGDYATTYQQSKERALRDTAPNTDRPFRRLAPWIGAFLSGLFLIAFTVSAVTVARMFGSLWVLAIFVMNAVFIGSLTVYAYRRWGAGLVRIGLAFAVICSLWNDNHPVALVRDSTQAAAARPSLEARLDTMLRSLPPRADGKPTPVVLVAAAGGGLRAAYWAAMTLALLQDADSQFARHAIVMSGVSGGSLGVATFAALARDGTPNAAGFACANDEIAKRERPPVPGPYSTCVRRFTRDDYLSPVLAKMLAPDFGQRFIPWPVRWADRSTAIEEAWERTYQEATGHNTFDSGMAAFPHPPAPTPILLLNSTHVETGKRYVASQTNVDGALDDTRDVLAELRSDVPLSAAVHNSARFTYVSPAGHLDRGDGRERGHVVDGGYFENSGLVTLYEVYTLLRPSRSPGGAVATDRSTTDSIADRQFHILAIYLCNDPLSCDGRKTSDSTGADSAARVRSTLAGEALSPVKAVLAARDARGALALAEMRRALGSDFHQLNVCSALAASDTIVKPPAGDTAQSRQGVETDVRRRARERVISPPLGWSLSTLARRWMDESLVRRADGTNDGPCPTNNRAQLAAILSALR